MMPCNGTQRITVGYINWHHSEWLWIKKFQMGGGTNNRGGASVNGTGTGTEGGRPWVPYVPFSLGEGKASIPPNFFLLSQNGVLRRTSEVCA